MKTRLMIFALMLIGFISGAQEPVGKKPSEWSNANKAAVRTAIKVDSIAVAKADSLITARTDTAAYYTAVETDSIVVTKTNHLVRAYELLGIGIKAVPLNYAVPGEIENYTVSDGILFGVAVYIQDTMTISGVRWNIATLGDYTADAYNGVGLYGVSGTTYTKVAATENDGDIWKTATSSVGSKAFTSSYVASPGVYYIVFLYNQSAQVTAPVFNGHRIGIMNGPNTTNRLSWKTTDARTTLEATIDATVNVGGNVDAVQCWLY